MVVSIICAQWSGTKSEGKVRETHRVQGAVDLVEEIKGRGGGRLQREAQRQRDQRLLPAAERGKGAPALAVGPA